MTLTEGFARLLGRLGQEEIGALDLLETSLRLCRDHRDVVVRALRDPAFDQLRHDAGSAFQSRLQDPKVVRSSLVGQDVGRHLSQICEGLLARAADDGDGARASVLRTLAEAVDASHHAQIATAWTLRGGRQLRSGDLVPAFSPFASPKFRRMYGPVGTPPFKLTRSADETIHAVLVPDLPHAMTLRVEPAWHALDALAPQSRLACAIPSGLDFDPQKLIIDRERLRFFGAVPVGVEQLRDVALELVREADSLGATVVALPELCLDTTGVEAIARWVEDEAEHIELAVCGTHHTDGDGARRNVAVVASPSAPRLEQAKLVGMEWRPPDIEEELLEDIQRNNTPLVLITSSSWSALVLICRDFIDRELSQLAVALRTSLVLAPSCSPRSVDFGRTAEHLATQAQAHTLVVNKCSDNNDAPDVAWLSRPVPWPDPPPAALPARELDLPSLVTTYLNEGDWKLDK